MKVAFFLFFPRTIWTPGGGETQLLKTKEALEKRGVHVELFDIWSRRKDYDLIHIFGSTYEVSSFVQTAKEVGLKVVVSAIAYSNRPAWQWRLWRRLDSFVPLPTTYRLRQLIYDSADIIIAGSRAEANQLSKGFRIDPSKVRIVPLGIEAERFLQVNPTPFVEKYGLRDFVLQVSRINRHKGQARLIRALRGTGLKVVFIGPLDPGDPEGVQEFMQLVSENSDFVHYLGAISHDDPLLPSAYAAARVHALPSRVESFGLVTLEALASGVAAVSGKYPPLYEALGDRVYYCDPLSETSIRNAVLEAFERGPVSSTREYVLKNLSWDKVAERLEGVYREVVG